MQSRRQFTRSGGCMLAFTLVAGAAVGTIVGQPSIGILAGSVVGFVLVIVVLVLDKQRSG